MSYTLIPNRLFLAPEVPDVAGEKYLSEAYQDILKRGADPEMAEARAYAAYVFGKSEGVKPQGQDTILEGLALATTLATTITRLHTPEQSPETRVEPHQMVQEAQALDQFFQKVHATQVAE